MGFLIGGEYLEKPPAGRVGCEIDSGGVRSNLSPFTDSAERLSPELSVDAQISAVLVRLLVSDTALLA